MLAAVPVNAAKKLYRCACGYEGNLFQVTGHQGRRRKNAEHWPECQGGPIPLERTSAGTSPAGVAAAVSPWDGPASGGEALEEELDPYRTTSDVDGSSLESGAPSANGNGKRRPEAGGQVQESVSAINATLFKESVSISPVLRVLHDMLRRDEGLNDSFSVWIEKSVLARWRDLGYEVSVVIRSPEGEMAEVG